MKKSIFLTVLLSGFGLTSFSQITAQCKINTLIAGGGNNFEIVGEESNQMVDSLFSNLPNTKRKGYKWKFKNIIIPGIDAPVTFQVHQGMAGCEDNGRFYFVTFTSEDNKTERQTSKNEEEAIIIYVKRGRNHILKTEEQTKIVREYLLSIYA